MDDDDYTNYPVGWHIEVEHTFPGVILALEEPGYYIVSCVLPEHMINEAKLCHRDDMIERLIGVRGGAKSQG